MYEPLIYGNINEYSAKQFIENINRFKTDDNIRVRVNSDGGEVRYGWGMINKLSEMKGKKTLCNDGEANSMAAFTFCYADDAEAHSSATFMFHRAGFGTWYESNPEYFTESERTYLVSLNESLRKAFEAKVDTECFRNETGVSVEQLFSMMGRVEATLTAEQAKRCGLINRVTELNISAKAEIKRLATAHGGKIPVEAQNTITNNQIKNKMTVEQLQSEHPKVYAEVFNAGKTAGKTEEKDRVEACLVYHEADPKGVVEAIKKGEALTATKMAEFSMKAIMASKVTNLESETKENEVVTEAVKAKAEAEKKELADFVAGVKENSSYFKTDK